MSLTQNPIEKFIPLLDSLRSKLSDSCFPFLAIGSFYQPRAVIADTALLDSLPDAEMRSGSAEVIKYGLAMDAELFDTLVANAHGELGREELPMVVARCAALKAEVVCRDETDRSGVRAILNFGHTVGHAIEAAGGLKKWRNG